MKFKQNELAILILALRQFDMTKYENKLVKTRDKLKRQLEKELLVKYNVVISKEYSTHTTSPLEC